MNTKALLITGILLAASGVQTIKADKKGEEYQKSYNYQRGVELTQVFVAFPWTQYWSQFLFLSWNL